MAVEAVNPAIRHHGTLLIHEKKENIDTASVLSFSLMMVGTIGLEPMTSAM